MVLSSLVVTVRPQESSLSATDELCAAFRYHPLNSRGSLIFGIEREIVRVQCWQTIAEGAEDHSDRWLADPWAGMAAWGSHPWLEGLLG